MKKKTLIQIVLFLVCLVLLPGVLSLHDSNRRGVPVAVEKKASFGIPLSVRPSRKDSVHVGETLTYDIKMGAIKLGSSVFRHLPAAEVNGDWLQVMSFETNLTRFKDTEKIYSAPETFLPVTVSRDILNWFVREKITEEYDQKNFTLVITKERGKRQDKAVIQKKGPIQHPILLPHYVRDLPELKVGQVFPVELPKRAFVIKLVSVEDVSVPAGDFKAYRFESSPAQIAIWISADDKRLPLKIQGIGVLNYVMVLREYSRNSPAIEVGKLSNSRLK